MTLLEQIRDSIFGRNFPFAEYGLLLGMVALVFLIALVFGIIALVQMRRARYYPHGHVVDPAEIRDIVREAFDQRRPFEIQLQAEDQNARRPTLRCAPQSMGGGTITLDLGSGVKMLSDSWIGKKINVYFRVGIHREFIYYTFASQIRDFHSHPTENSSIDITFPAMLDNRQKRAFLRMLPPADLVLGMALWHSWTMPTPEKIHDLVLWPRPLLLLVPGRMEQFKLLDLSAGGLRLAIPAAIMAQHELEFSSIDSMIVMLDLYDPEQEKRLRFWMQCRVQNTWSEGAGRATNVGAQFRSWARPKDGVTSAEGASILEWLRLSSSFEVEPIGNWVMRRHLEIYRDIPAD